MSFNRPKPVFRSFVGLLCLLAYLGVATPMVPVLTVVTAWMDGEHRVSMSMAGQSSRIVLSHDANDPIKFLSHSHCAVSRGLASLAEPQNPFHPDHVLQFAAAEIAAPRSVLQQALTAEIPELPQPAFSLHSLLAVPDSRAPLNAAATLPTPALSVAFARVTVLLI